MILSLTYCAASIGVLMFSMWLLSLYLRDVSIIDIAWGMGFTLVAWTAYWTRGGIGDSVLVPSLTTLWGVRLSIYLAWRNHGKDEDPRYQKMRQRWGNSFPWVSLLTVFGVQAVVMWIVSLPLQMLMTRCRVLENQVRAVEASRDQWRQKYRDSQDLKKINS